MAVLEILCVNPTGITALVLSVQR